MWTELTVRSAIAEPVTASAASFPDVTELSVSFEPGSELAAKFVFSKPIDPSIRLVLLTELAASFAFVTAPALIFTEVTALSASAPVSTEPVAMLVASTALQRFLHL